MCLLKKSLYGLKQSPRQWNKRFDEFMVQHGYKRSSSYACVYTREGSDGSLIYLLLYVDDMLLAAKNVKDAKKLKEQLESSFEMKDLGPARRILGMDIYRDISKGILRLAQTEYIRKVVSNFRMEGAKSSLTPMGAHFKLYAVKE